MARAPPEDALVSDSRNLLSSGSNKTRKVIVVTKVLMLNPNELHPHEDTDPERVESMLAMLRATHEFYPPLLVDNSTRVVLDGHHRLEASKILGCTRIPCYCVDYLEDDSVALQSWRPDDAITKREVIDMGTGPNTFPLKTTRHIYRIPDSIGPVPLEDLLPDGASG